MECCQSFDCVLYCINVIQCYWPWHEKSVLANNKLKMIWQLNQNTPAPYWFSCYHWCYCLFLPLPLLSEVSPVSLSPWQQSPEIKQKNLAIGQASLTRPSPQVVIVRHWTAYEVKSADTTAPRKTVGWGWVILPVSTAMATRVDSCSGHGYLEREISGGGSEHGRCMFDYIVTQSLPPIWNAPCVFSAMLVRVHLHLPDDGWLSTVSYM